VRTNGTRGCVRALVIPDIGEERILPETGETRIDLGTPQAGRLDYACGMGMYTGQITFTRAAPTPSTSAPTPSGSATPTAGTR
jgi:plastocyanin domain-containing protein